MERRTFLKAGLAGGVALAAGGWWWRRATRRERTGPAPLGQAGRGVLAAIVPVVLGGALPADPAAEALAVKTAVDRIAGLIAGLPPAAQGELEDLFGLLSMPLARRWLAGVREDWPRASREDVQAFLQSWRTHRFALMRSAYQALRDLSAGAYYSDESTWPGLGYAPPAQVPL